MSLPEERQGGESSGELAGSKDAARIRPPSFWDALDLARESELRGEEIPFHTGFQIFNEPRKWKRSLRLPKPVAFAKGFFGKACELLRIPQWLFRLPRSWRRIRARQTVCPVRTPLPRTNITADEYVEQVSRNRYIIPKFTYFRDALTSRQSTMDKTPFDKELVGYLRTQALFLKRTETLPIFLKQKALRYLEENPVEMKESFKCKLIASAVTQALILTDTERRLMEVASWAGKQDFTESPRLTLAHSALIATTVILGTGIVLKAGIGATNFLARSIASVPWKSYCQALGSIVFQPVSTGLARHTESCTRLASSIRLECTDLAFAMNIDL
uniref:Uncharacterized protein n=1 Tax=Hymenopteran tombus-related virus TaxID=2822555 RepID=A0A8A6RH70_9TOMB|nr:hypothetical protein [Hymenopteran tombus-related virus]